MEIANRRMWKFLHGCRSKSRTEQKGELMGRIDDVIADQAYILDCLIALRNIYKTGNCNECSQQTCEYIPDPDQYVGATKVYFGKGGVL